MSSGTGADIAVQLQAYRFGLGQCWLIHPGSISFMFILRDLRESITDVVESIMNFADLVLQAVDVVSEPFDRVAEAHEGILHFMKHGV